MNESICKKGGTQLGTAIEKSASAAARVRDAEYPGHRDMGAPYGHSSAAACDPKRTSAEGEGHPAMGAGCKGDVSSLESGGPKFRAYPWPSSFRGFMFRKDSFQKFMQQSYSYRGS